MFAWIINTLRKLSKSLIIIRIATLDKFIIQARVNQKRDEIRMKMWICVDPTPTSLQACHGQKNSRTSEHIQIESYGWRSLYRFTVIFTIFFSSPFSFHGELLKKRLHHPSYKNNVTFGLVVDLCTIFHWKNCFPLDDGIIFLNFTEDLLQISIFVSTKLTFIPWKRTSMANVEK